MTASDARFQGSIPTLYETLLVPLVFAPYAEDVAARVGSVDGDLLEIACGTGSVTRALASAAPRARIVATDLNEAMLGVARERCPHANVTWKQADAQALPFDDGSFDVVVCQFGYMFLPDRARGFREARRVLRPNGRLLFNVWGRAEDNEASLVISRAVGALFPNDPPRFLERTPFGYFDEAQLRADTAAGGFERVEVETVDRATRASAEMLARGLVEGSPLRGEIEARAADRLEEATRAATQALVERYGATVDNRMRALVVTARR